MAKPVQLSVASRILLESSLSPLDHCSHRSQRPTRGSKDIRKSSAELFLVHRGNRSKYFRLLLHSLPIGNRRKRVPQPYGPAFDGTAAHDLLQFDLIAIAPSTTGQKYILMLRYDHSGCNWFYAFLNTSADNPARAMIDSAAAFGVLKGLISDGPMHFKNETVRLLSQGLTAPHHCTLPYRPWSIKGVERLGKWLLPAFRSVTSKLQIRSEKWPDLFLLVRSALSCSPSPHCENVSPATALTGLTAALHESAFFRISICSSVPIARL